MHFCCVCAAQHVLVCALRKIILHKAKAKKLPLLLLTLILHLTTKPLDAKKDNLQLNQKNSPCLIHSYLALDNKILGCWERWQLSCRAHSDPWGRSANPSPQSQHAVLRVDGTQALGHAAMGMLEANGDLLHCLCLQVGLHLPAERCTLNERSSLSPDRWVILYMQWDRVVHAGYKTCVSWSFYWGMERRWSSTMSWLGKAGNS